MKYRLSEIAAVCRGKLEGEDVTCRAVITDSRAASGATDLVFFAMSGLNHNGHSYIGELYARGVRAFVVEQPVDAALYPEVGFVHVARSLTALQMLATHHRHLFKGVVVAITGSNGKTVVKEWAAQIAPHGMKLMRSPKSYNSQIGVPLSVLMIQGDEDVALIEAGISKLGEMAVLENIIRPDIGIITTLGDAHQENFETLKQKLAEKLLLFRRSHKIIYSSRYPLIYSELHALYPSATPSNKDLTAHKKAVEGAYGVDCNLRAAQGELVAVEPPRQITADDRLQMHSVEMHLEPVDTQGHVELIDAATQSAAYEYFTEHTAQENAALVLSLYDTLGYPHVQTVARLPLLQPVAMRLELKEGINNSIIINDFYNSDINSLSIALDYLASVAAGRRRTLILSDILQSGMNDEQLYTRVAEMAAASGVDHLIGIGERISNHASLFKFEHEFYPSTDAFLSLIDQGKLAGNTILIKGNRNSQFEKLSHALQLRTHTTILEVDLDAMIHNLTYFRSKLKPSTRVMAMIKAYSYGNGGYEVANMLQRQAVHYLAVAFADEGAALRSRGITVPIVVLNADQDSFEMMISNSLEPEIYNFASFEAFLGALARHSETNYPVHIKLDTGMHRLGFEQQDIGKLTEMLKDNSLIRVSTVFSHLAASDELEHEDFTRMQIALFNEMSSRIASSLTYPVLRHIANSAAAEHFPQAEFDMIRLGIGLYGISSASDPALRPVSTFSTRIVQIKELAADQTVGYGRAGKLNRTTRIATIPVGYADGLDRGLSNGNWNMIVRGQKAPIIGRICMDTCMIDVTDIEAMEGDTVIVFSAAEGNRVEDMARALQTIPYEVMTGISARVKRIFIKE